jgi:hypothetical protein
MQYYRCKCGKMTAWTTMGVHACTKCPKCGSDLAQGPESHSEPEPHEYVTKYDVNTGVPYEICQTCHRRRLELEKPYVEEPPPPPPDPYLELVKTCDGIAHCDALVLHRKENCAFCAMPKFEVLHVYRQQNGINYTGESDPTKKPCPAEAFRYAHTINRWHGNRPHKETTT